MIRSERLLPPPSRLLASLYGFVQVLHFVGYIVDLLWHGRTLNIIRQIGTAAALLILTCSNART